MPQRTPPLLRPCGVPYFFFAASPNGRFDPERSARMPSRSTEMCRSRTSPGALGSWKDSDSRSASCGLVEPGQRAEDLRVDADLLKHPGVVRHHVDEVDLHQLLDEARRPGQLVQLLLVVQRVLDVRLGDADPVRDRRDAQHRLDLGGLVAELGGGLAGQPQALFLAGAGAVDGDIADVQAHPADVGGDTAVTGPLNARLGPYPQFMAGDRQLSDRADRIGAHFAEFHLRGAEFAIHVVEGEQHAAVHGADRGALDGGGQIAVDTDVVGGRLEFRQGDPVGGQVGNRRPSPGRRACP